MCGCALTPATSFGFELIDFAADVLRTPFDPWQEFLSIHAGELLRDGRPRFRRVLVLVARQQGKTHWARALILWWLYVDLVGRTSATPPTVLGISSQRHYAKKVWEACWTLAKRIPELADGVEKIILRGGEESFHVRHDDDSMAQYDIAASNSDAGRSLTVWRLLMDELRQQHSWEAYDAAVPTTDAVWDAQIVMISNQGDARAVVLDSVRGDALSAIPEAERGAYRGPFGNDGSRLGLFEWSAPGGADPDDPAALVLANPNANRRTDLADLVERGRLALATGGKVLAGFRTESMCQRVRALDPAIDPGKWAACRDDGLLTDVPRTRVALCFDVALDGTHATLVAAAQLDDGRVRVSPVEAWDGADAVKKARRALPALVKRVRPLIFAWFPNGPAATVAAELRDAGARRGTWPPPGVTVQEITGETPDVCMGFAGLVDACDVAQSGDPLLTAHLTSAQRLKRGDRWVFSRRAGSDSDEAPTPVDGAYAAAGAAHVARTMPRPQPRGRLVLADDQE